MPWQSRHSGPPTTPGNPLVEGWRHLRQRARRPGNLRGLQHTAEAPQPQMSVTLYTGHLRCMQRERACNAHARDALMVHVMVHVAASDGHN